MGQVCPYGLGDERRVSEERVEARQTVSPPRANSWLGDRPVAANLPQGHWVPAGLLSKTLPLQILLLSASVIPTFSLIFSDHAQSLPGNKFANKSVIVSENQKPPSLILF